MARPDGFRWNPRSHQPDHTLSKWERKKRYLANLDDHARMLWYGLARLPAVFSRYRKRLPHLYRAPHDLAAGFGLGTDSEPRLLERMATEIPDLGAEAALVRVHAWDLEHLDLIRGFLLEMRRLGLATAVAILQDRQSVLDLEHWRGVLDRIFTGLGDSADHFEVGHAWNRIKWGVESFEEYLDLAEIAFQERLGHPGIGLMGPAVIDFEYVYHMGALLHARRAPRFDVVSSLLYVDRRGAPENRQYGFDLAHKALLLRAVADVGLGPDVPLWVTETNWPLPMPGGYSPTAVKEGISLEAHADYLTRYYLQALASGVVEKVFWWQVAAHGYGLIDDLDGRWERRPAWRAFRAMTSLLRGARLAAACPGPDLWAFTFETAAGRRLTAAWARLGETEFHLDFPVGGIISRDGDPLPPPHGGSLRLSQAPLYILHR